MGHSTDTTKHALTYGNHKSPVDRFAVYPLALRILRLQPKLIASLEEIAGKHAIFMRTHPLSLDLPLLPVDICSIGWQVGHIDFGILDDLELVLLVVVKELIERICLQPNCFADQ